MEGMAGFALGLAIAAFSLGVGIGHELVARPIVSVLKVMGAQEYPQSARIPEHVLRRSSAGIFVTSMFYLVAALR
jgi:hypothetical protein